MTLKTTRPGPQDGFTLIELLVASAMMVVITGAAVSMLISSMHSQSDVTSRADQIGNARNAIEKITADIRGGESATLGSPSELMVRTPCSSGPEGLCSITYRCSQVVAAAGSCVREAEDGSRTTIVSGLSWTSVEDQKVFCVYPNSEGSECGPESASASTDTDFAPRYVGVTIRLPSSSETESQTVLQNGAALHNSPNLLHG